MNDEAIERANGRPPFLRSDIGTYLPMQAHRDRRRHHGLPFRNELSDLVAGDAGEGSPATSTPSSHEMESGDDVPPRPPADLPGAYPALFPVT